MPKSPKVAQKYPVTASFNITYLEDGLRIALLPVPDDLLKLVGSVIAYWGQFEFHFSAAVGALLKHAGREEPGWDRLGFRKRRVLLRTLVKEVYGQANPAISDAFTSVANMAGSLYWRRNLVAHGTYAFTIAAMSNDGEFRAEGFHNGKPVSMPLNHEHLESLWHEIAHLDGALYEVLSEVGEIGGYWPTLLDKEILQVYSESNHPWNPNPDKRIPPPQSSEA
jgi:hypothetical protein